MAVNISKGKKPEGSVTINVPVVTAKHNINFNLNSPEKLADASQMYQPVRGTSTGSVYSVVALSDLIKVAARVTGQKLSMRVEGKGIESQKIADKLTEMGFAPTAGSHYSMHMACGEVPADRVIGAILAGLGVEFQTPLPVLVKVKENSK